MNWANSYSVRTDPSALQLQDRDVGDLGDVAPVELVGCQYSAHRSEQAIRVSVRRTFSPRWQVGYVRD
jgi:hypothetical protein